jgi:hypothetical protein
MDFVDANLKWLLQLAMETKETLVQHDGIGADIPPMVAAFDETGAPLGQAQLATDSDSAQHQLERLLGVATLMRVGWHAAALAIVIEGYMMLVESDDDTPVSVRFANGDPNVVECVTLIYVSVDGVPSVVSVPYRLMVGRKVEWMHHERQDVDGFGAMVGAYPKFLAEMHQTARPIPRPECVPVEVTMMAIATEIVDRGFFVFCDALDEQSQSWLDALGETL